VSRIGRAVLGLLAAAVCAVAPAEAAKAAVETEGAACEVDYRPYPYSGGFTATVTLRNTGTVTINGWTFLFPVDDGVEVIEIWEAELVAPSGLVTARNQPHNPVLEPGGSLTIGFRARGAQQAHPSTFTINTVVCTAAPRPVGAGA
jgi:Cellulose binding domain